MSWTWPANAGASGGSGGAPAKTAALLPAGQFGAIWQIAAQQAGFVVSGADRSGSNLSCGDVNPLALPDLVPGKLSLMPSGSLPSPQPLLRVATPALALKADMTLMFRFALLGYNIEGAAQYVVSYAKFSDGTEAGACLWSAVFEASANQNVRLAYFAQSGPTKVAQLAFCTSLPVKGDGWHFGCIRRDATGTSVDVQVDTTSVNTSGLLAPTGGTTSFPCLGWDTAAPQAEGLHGLIADINLWSVRLSDAQVEVCRKIMMGL